jgi:hypothetical protein
VSVRTYGPVRFSLGADGDLSRWSIAGPKMKSGKPHDVRLSGPARHHAWQDTPALFTTMPTGPSPTSVRTTIRPTASASVTSA